jgi:hypothetical protein
MKLAQLRHLAFAFGLFASLSLASPEPALQAGEQLKYSVSWAIVPGAGEILVSAAMQGDQLKVTTHTGTRRLAKILLPFEATSESFYEQKTGRLLSIHERSVTRNKYAEFVTTFDYANRRAAYTRVGDTTAKFIDMPQGAPADLISALLETRNWNIKPGDSRDALVLFGDEFYELTIHALRYEEVKTKMGRFQALVLEPRMEKTPPKGMFKRGSSVRVWIAQDQARLPVKFEVEFNIGTGTASLESYTPPTAATSPSSSGNVPSASNPTVPASTSNAPDTRP